MSSYFITKAIFTFAFLIICSAHCPTENETLAVNLRELSGKWWVVAGTTPEKKMGSCSKFDVNFVGTDKYAMNFMTISANNSQRMTWNINGNYTDKVMYGNWKLPKGNASHGPLEQRIVKYNLDESIVMIFCYRNKTHVSARFGSILARDKSYNDSNDRVMLSNYVDKTKIKTVDNTCSEK